MFRTKGHRAAIVTTGVIVAAIGGSAWAATGAQASGRSASWHIVKQVHGGAFADVTAVAAVGRNGGWAFDGQGNPTAWERNGSHWSQVSFPGKSNEMVVAAAATAPSDVWAFTDNTGHSRALRWNGHKWSVAGTFSRSIGAAAVLSPSNVWVFGQPYVPGGGLGAWHYDGHNWSRVAGGGGLEGASALSARDIWAFDGTDVAHWNGKAWTRTSVKALLPAKQLLNGPSVTGIYAQSHDSVYAIGNGNLQDEGGPLVVLHYNGHTWTKVAQGNYGFGTEPLQQISSDGHGGLWLPMPGVFGQKSYLLHYSNGRLSQTTLPVPSSKINVETVSLIPGSSDVLAGGFSHAADNTGGNDVAVLLEYAP